MRTDGLPDFAPRFESDLVRPFWDAIRRGELCLPCCSECGKWQWYPNEFVTCHPDANHIWKSIATTGRVFTFTVVHRSFLPNADRGAEPYISALVEPDGLEGVRIPAVLTELAVSDVRIGMQVKLKPLVRSDYVLPAFCPN